MVLPSSLARRGAGGTWKSTRSAAGDMICTFMPFLLLRATRPLALYRASSAHGDGRDLPQLGQHLLGEARDALFGLDMRHESRPPNHHQMAKTADFVVKLHDLLVDCVGAAGEQNPPRHRLLRRDA